MVNNLCLSRKNAYSGQRYDFFYKWGIKKSNFCFLELKKQRFVQSFSRDESVSSENKTARFM